MPCPPSASAANDYPTPLWISSGGIQGPAGRASDQIFDGTIQYSPCTTVFGSPAPTTIAQWACQVEQKWISQFDLAALPTGTSGQVLARAPGTGTTLYKPESIASVIARSYNATPHTVFSTNSSGTAGFYPLGSGFYQVVTAGANNLTANTPNVLGIQTSPVTTAGSSYNDFAGSLALIPGAFPSSFVGWEFTVPVTGRWKFRGGGNFWFLFDGGGPDLSWAKAVITIIPSVGATAQVFDIALESANPIAGENWHFGLYGELPSLQLSAGAKVQFSYLASGPAGSSVLYHGASTSVATASIPFGGAQAGYFTGVLERL